MIEVKVGQIWKDLDPRSNRTMRVTYIGNGKAVLNYCNSDGTFNFGETTKISVGRLAKQKGLRLWGEVSA